MIPKNVYFLSCHTGWNLRWPEILAVFKKQKKHQHFSSLRHAVTHYFLHGELSNLLSLMPLADAPSSGADLPPRVMGFPYMFHTTSAAAENTMEADEVK